MKPTANKDNNTNFEKIINTYTLFSLKIRDPASIKNYNKTFFVTVSFTVATSFENLTRGGAKSI